METKTYGTFTRDFDYYTVEVTEYYQGEVMGGREIVRTEHLSDALESLSSTLDHTEDVYSGEADTREEYDFGITYVFDFGHSRTLVELIGRNND